MWHVYIIETNDGRLYTGMTNNVERRFKQHVSGKEAKFTRIFGVKALKYSCSFETRVEAMQKKWKLRDCRGKKRKL